MKVKSSILLLGLGFLSSPSHAIIYNPSQTINLAIPVAATCDATAATDSTTFSITTFDSLCKSSLVSAPLGWSTVVNTRYTLAGASGGTNATACNTWNTTSQSNTFAQVTGLSPAPGRSWKVSNLYAPTGGANINNSSAFLAQGCQGASFINSWAINPSFFPNPKRGGAQAGIGYKFSTPINIYDNTTTNQDLMFQADIKSPWLSSNNLAYAGNESGFVAQVSILAVFRHKTTGRMFDLTAVVLDNQYNGGTVFTGGAFVIPGENGVPARSFISVPLTRDTAKSKYVELSKYSTCYNDVNGCLHVAPWNDFKAVRFHFPYAKFGQALVDMGFPVAERQPYDWQLANTTVFHEVAHVSGHNVAGTNGSSGMAATHVGVYLLKQ